MNASLEGVRIVVTRPAGRGAERWCRELAQRGARLVRLPVLEVVAPANPRPLRAALRRLEEYDWIVFTSSNSVDAVASVRLGEWPRPPRLAAVGPLTAETLRRHGQQPDLLPTEANAVGLAEALRPVLQASMRILLPHAADADPRLADELRQTGCALDAIVAYAKQMPAAATEQLESLLADSELGVVTFGSPSAARNLAHALGDSWVARRTGLVAASIGPTTSAALRELGVEPACEAPTPGIAALADAIQEHLHVSPALRGET